MSQAIGLLSPSAVIEAIEGNLVDSSAALGRSGDGVVYRGSDVTWVYTGGPVASRVLSARFTDEDVQDRVAEIHRYFKEWSAPVSWVVGPSSYPPTLGKYLSASGFGNGEAWTGLAMDLSSVGPALKVVGLDIQEILNNKDLADWATVKSESPFETDEMFSLASGERDKRCRYYLANIKGKPVARVMTCRRDDVVGLYWITTLPDAHGQQICTALAHRAMQDAANAGAKAAVMAVSSKGVGVSERLGFKPYCHFNVYSWPPTSKTAAQC